MKKKSKKYLENGQKCNIKKYFEEENCVAVNSVSEYENQMKLLYMEWQGVEFEGKEILALGCGKADLECILIDKYKVKNITLLDASVRYTSIAMKKCKEATIICADLIDIETNMFERKFDVIYSFDVMQYIRSEDIVYIQKKLIECLKDTGSIYHFGVPDKKRRWISRIDRYLTNRDVKQILFPTDFVDSYSHWLKKKDFFCRDYKITYITPSLRMERFDVKIQKG